MRQFRGQAKDGSGWKYGSLVYMNLYGYLAYYIFVIEDKNGTGTYYEVFGETVGKFWQNDKNGVGIYKGSIVKDSEETYVLEYGEFEDRDVDDLMYGWYMIHVPSGETFVAYSDTSQLEVIGSVHDNPELL